MPPGDRPHASDPHPSCGDGSHALWRKDLYPPDARGRPGPPTQRRPEAGAAFGRAGVYPPCDGQTHAVPFAIAAGPGTVAGDTSTRPTPVEGGLVASARSFARIHWNM